MNKPENTIIDDLWHRGRWQAMLAGSPPGEQLELASVRQIACAGASTGDIERHGEAWTASFLSFAERAGIGLLKLRSDGSHVLVLADPLPSEAEAWERVQT